MARRRRPPKTKIIGGFMNKKMKPSSGHKAVRPWANPHRPKAQTAAMKAGQRRYRRNEALANKKIRHLVRKQNNRTRKQRHAVGRKSGGRSW